MKYKLYNYDAKHKSIFNLIFLYILLLIFTLFIYIPQNNFEFNFKVIDSLNYTPIANAEFILTDNSSNKVYFSSSNNNGIVTFSNIPAGKYVLNEYFSPQGFLPNKTKYNIYIGFDGSINFENRPISELIITNIPDKTFKVTYISNTQIVSFTTYSLGNYTIINYPFEESKDNFLNWNTSSDSSGTTYIPGEVINLKRDFILYAVFE